MLHAPQMVSTPFQSREYYPNIRRALLAGFFMQVRGRVPRSGPQRALRATDAKPPCNYEGGCCRSPTWSGLATT